MGNIRIGTRASKLAVWQAKQVQALLQKINISSSIIKIKSSGDKDLSKPVYELGITGVFTKELDIALLNNEIDIAVHSLKDVPTILPLGVRQGAVLQRGSELDIVIHNKPLNSKENTIATGSLRRKAQWLNKFKTDNIVEIRGNVQTRKQLGWNYNGKSWIRKARNITKRLSRVRLDDSCSSSRSNFCSKFNYKFFDY